MAVMRIIALLALVACLTGCDDNSRSAANEIAADSLWIWAYVDKPAADANAGTLFAEVLSLAEAGFQPHSLDSFIYDLSEFGSLRESPVRIVKLESRSFNVSLDRTYGWEVGGRVVASEERLVLSQYIGDASRYLQQIDDREQMRALARALILLGYQTSRSGEDKITAVNRLVLWSTAARLLLDSQAHDADRLERIESCLSAKAFETRDWTDLSLREMGWEGCD